LKIQVNDLISCKHEKKERNIVTSHKTENNSNILKSIKKPFIFDGDKEMFEEFHEQVKNYCKFAEFDDKEKVYFLKSYLTKYPANWMRKYIEINFQSGAGEYHYAQTEKDFVEEFTPKNQEALFLQKIERLRMGTDYYKYKNTFVEYSQRVKASQVQLKTWFMRGLHTTIKAKLVPKDHWSADILLRRVNDIVTYCETINFTPWKENREHTSKFKKPEPNQIICYKCKYRVINPAVLAIRITPKIL
jgi:hypothetical protein